MRREKFIYNPKSLTFERYRTPFAKRLWVGILFLSTVVTTAAGLLYLILEFRPAPREVALLREIDQMKVKYSSLHEQLDMMSKVLENVQERDAGVHRLIFGMDPIDADLWSGGVGGHRQFGDVVHFENSGELLFSTMTRADELARKLVLQSRSLDSLEIIAGEKEAYLNAIPSIKPIRVDQVNRKINYLSGFGMRLHPIHKIPKMHTGLDFTARPGTTVRVTGNGKVKSVKRDRSGYGNHIMIDHGFGYQTLYAHLDKIEVREGQRVLKGEVLGTVGNSGTSTAPHLHYEVHFKGKPVNPIHYCMDGLTPAEYEEMVHMASESNKSLD